MSFRRVILALAPVVILLQMAICALERRIGRDEARYHPNIRTWAVVIFRGGNRADPN